MVVTYTNNNNSLTRYVESLGHSGRNRDITYEIFTFALEGTSRCRQKQFVPHCRGFHTPGYTRLHIIFLHPFGQPPHAAVAVKRVGPQGAVNIVIDKWLVAKIERMWFANGTILTDAL